ncbi:HlyD family secretion protein [Mucilaginibacter pallidiroseus]|uniref:HlyD family secretion protein n=1 Tax=Mucilaginibacter pallidiroseus TaxID=2599295 RepID=A0A563U1R9_9SPHI|nr:HlyD family secretion protein [Mucilaginibacter pallidiroseus]TWR24399.1 HlyD family secretion protein [Mucilaginibacter pallidiroseus]
MTTSTAKRPLTIILTGFAITIIAGAACFFFLYFLKGSRYQETNDAQVESFINPVSARVGGYIRTVRFEEHQSVREGDTLVTLDDREYLQRVLEAEATVDDANAQVDVLNAGIASLEAASKVNRDQVNGAKARLILQKADITRYKNLARDEAVTGSDLDAVQSRYDVSKSDYSAALNSLQASYAKIAEMKTRRELLAADLKRKNALLELARINLAYTVIRAPYSGRMGRKSIQDGQQIQPGQPLVSIVNERDKWITANFKETQVNGMYVGQPVEIRVDAISGVVYKGKIEAIAASTGAKFSLLPPDNATGNFVKVIQRIPVKIRFTDKDITPVKAGMNVLVAVKNKGI